MLRHGHELSEARLSWRDGKGCWGLQMRTARGAVGGKARRLLH